MSVNAITQNVLARLCPNYIFRVFLSISRLSLLQGYIDLLFDLFYSAPEMYASAITQKVSARLSPNQIFRVFLPISTLSLLGGYCADSYFIFAPSVYQIIDSL